MSDLTAKLSTLIEKVQLSAKSSNSKIDVKYIEEEPSTSSNLLIESDRDNLLNYLYELEERNEVLTDENRILSAALGEHFTQKKVTRAFHELRDEEEETYTKKYYSKMEYLCKIKMKRKILQDEFEEKQSIVIRELEEEKNEFDKIKNGTKKLNKF